MKDKIYSKIEIRAEIEALLSTKSVPEKKVLLANWIRELNVLLKRARETKKKPNLRRFLLSSRVNRSYILNIKREIEVALDLRARLYIRK